MMGRDVETLVSLSNITHELDRYGESIKDFFGITEGGINKIDNMVDEMATLAKSLVDDKEFANSDEFFNKFLLEPDEFEKLLKNHVGGKEL